MTDDVLRHHSLLARLFHAQFVSSIRRQCSGRSDRLGSGRIGTCVSPRSRRHQKLCAFSCLRLVSRRKRKRRKKFRVAQRGGVTAGWRRRRRGKYKKGDEKKKKKEGRKAEGERETKLFSSSSSFLSFPSTLRDRKVCLGFAGNRREEKRRERAVPPSLPLTFVCVFILLLPSFFLLSHQQAKAY